MDYTQILTEIKQTLNAIQASLATIKTAIDSTKTTLKNEIKAQGEANADSNRFVVDSGKAVKTPYTNNERTFVVAKKGK